MPSLLLKRLVVGAAGLLMTASCTAATEVADVAETPTRVAVGATEPTAEVAPATLVPEPTATVAPPPPSAATPVPEPTATVAAEPTATTPPTPAPTPAPPRVAIATTDHSGLAGTRGLTLQWISWEPSDWGLIEFVPLVDGSYAVAGTQQALNGDALSVDGTIVRVSDRELLFRGDVVVTLTFSNDGEPCVRSGDITFLATGDRQFWRMQDLLNCDGVITDYVDIYFG